MLADSLANFHLSQQEIAWTLIAYSLYLPPIASWTNRYGEKFSFDDLVTKVLVRSLDAESCGGTHLLYSLTVLARADEQRPVLSDSTRRELEDYLRRAVNVVVATQQDNGSWHSAWNYTLLPGGEPRRWSTRDDDASRLVMTGHITEWLLYLPEELQVEGSVVKRAGIWLKDQLLKASLATKEEQFCPYTHATCVLRQISFNISRNDKTGSTSWQRVASK